MAVESRRYTIGAITQITERLVAKSTSELVANIVLQRKQFIRRQVIGLPRTNVGGCHLFGQLFVDGLQFARRRSNRVARLIQRLLRFNGHISLETRHFTFRQICQCVLQFNENPA